MVVRVELSTMSDCIVTGLFYLRNTSTSIWFKKCLSTTQSTHSSLAIVDYFNYINLMCFF